MYPSTLSLAGAWRLRLDRDDLGRDARWYAASLGRLPAAPTTDAGLCHLPGSVQAQGFGDAPSIETRWVGAIADRSFFGAPEYESARQPGPKFSVPFWLTPKRHYVGVAWFEREVEVPAELAGASFFLDLERTHWCVEAWIDGGPLECDRGGQQAGSSSGESLHTPNTFIVPPLAAGPHRVTLRIDNRLHVPIGENAHSVSDHTQTDWLGVVGELALRPVTTILWKHVELHPATDRRSVRIRLRWFVSLFERPPANAFHARVEVRASDGRKLGELVVPLLDAQEVVVPLVEQAPVWDEFTPALCAVRVDLCDESGAVHDTRTERTGFRSLGTAGRHLTINGRRLFLRGTLDCAVFPLTGYPPTDEAEWRRILGTIRAHGLNHVRFHSWCPPRAAFRVADELGLYLQVECGAWTEVGTGTEVDAWLEREGARILATYGNHPSFCSLTHGNEPQGGAARDAYLGRLVERWRAADDRHLYTAGAGWPEIAASDYHIPYTPRIHGWTAERRSRLNALPPETTSDYRYYTTQYDKPVVSHEIGQWCVFPRLEERAKYRGLSQARAFELVEERLAASGQLALASALQNASGKLQALCYKEEIESALRTADMGGFQLLGLGDFPGQGTAQVGVLDAFWQEKGYIAPDAFRRFCGATVPLLALPRRVFTGGDTLTARVLVAHYGAVPLHDVLVTWELKDAAGHVARHGGLSPAGGLLAVGLNRIGELYIPLDGTDLAAPARHTIELKVSASGSKETRAGNDWAIWLYPDSTPLSAPGVLVHDRLDKLTLGALARGETVILSPGEDGVRPDPKLGPIKLGFTPIFWNTAWTFRQGPHTLGILCDPAHAALAAFPTDAHSDWQWWYIVTRAYALVLDALPREIEPIVRVIDDWATCRRLGLVFEARVGPGRLIATGIELRFAHESNPVARQLLASLLEYAQSAAFAPKTELTVEQLFTVFPERGAFDPL